MARPVMQVTFTKMIEKRGSYWEATPRGRNPIPGSNMALGRGDMPHDLSQLIVEAVDGMTDGFWGSVADGATFKSIGKKRTKAGRAVIAKNRAGLADAEVLAGQMMAKWIAGAESETSRQLTRFDELWRNLKDNESFTLVWPTLELIDSP